MEEVSQEVGGGIQRGWMMSLWRLEEASQKVGGCWRRWTRLKKVEEVGGGCKKLEEVSHEVGGGWRRFPGFI